MIYFVGVLRTDLATCAATRICRVIYLLWPLLLRTCIFCMIIASCIHFDYRVRYKLNIYNKTSVLY